MTTTISRRPNALGASIDPPSEPDVIRRVQVRQHNDSRLLEFFNTHGVEYDLTGDHLFIIRSRKMDMAAGPGDWLVVGPDGEVDVERGDYALRAQRAITRARNARRERSNVVEQQRKYRDLRERTERDRRRHEQFLERIARLQRRRPRSFRRQSRGVESAVTESIEGPAPAENGAPPDPPGSRSTP